jgi:proteasome lid subunit RPN8/RPN11
LHVLTISKADYDLIRWEAERSYPQECCGILLGQTAEGNRTVTLTIPCENVRLDTPERTYSIDPQQVIAALKLARSRGENIIGFYHSHPDHVAHYSATDLTEAHWFDCSYLITGVVKGSAIETESFLLIGSEEEKNFELEEIDIRS